MSTRHLKIHAFYILLLAIAALTFINFYMDVFEDNEHETKIPPEAVRGIIAGTLFSIYAPKLITGISGCDEKIANKATFCFAGYALIASLILMPLVRICALGVHMNRQKNNNYYLLQALGPKQYERLAALLEKLSGYNRYFCEEHQDAIDNTIKVFNKNEKPPLDVISELTDMLTPKFSSECFLITKNAHHIPAAHMKSISNIVVQAQEMLNIEKSTCNIKHLESLSVVFALALGVSKARSFVNSEIQKTPPAAAQKANHTNYSPTNWQQFLARQAAEQTTKIRA